MKGQASRDVLKKAVLIHGIKKRSSLERYYEVKKGKMKGCRKGQRKRHNLFQTMPFLNHKLLNLTKRQTLDVLFLSLLRPVWLFQLANLVQLRIECYFQVSLPFLLESKQPCLFFQLEDTPSLYF